MEKCSIVFDPKEADYSITINDIYTRNNVTMALYFSLSDDGKPADIFDYLIKYYPEYFLDGYSFDILKVNDGKRICHIR